MDHREGIVDLRSDTVTRPTPGMYEAMARAPLGDDVLGDDPTVRALEERVADMLGFERALFVPSGTMANLLAVCSQCERGDEIIIHEGGHVVNYETGAFAGVGGCVGRGVPSEDGTFGPEAISARVRPSDSHFARSRLVVVENTSNAGGGTVWAPDLLRRVRDRAHALGLLVHMDGARLWHASIACGVRLRELCEGFDTVSVCFSKGLGAPVGSAICGSDATIGRAHRIRKMLGGAMRQAGVLAGAALYALEHHIDRLVEDHAHARLLAEGIARVAGLRIDPGRVRTNIVVFEVDDASGLCERLRARGVWMLPVGPDRVRAVTHLDITRDDIERAIEAVGACC